jgi:hypothetical protein
LRIIPSPENFGRVQSKAELRVASLLEQIQLDERATCFYSVHLPRHEYKRMSEIDFMIVVNGLVLVVEVKGGRLARHDGIWTFTNRYGEQFDKREGPFDQARSAMFALRRLIEERLPRVGFEFGSVVITPDQHLDRDIEWADAEHIGPEAMSVSAFKSALAAAIRFWRRDDAARLPRERYQELLPVLRPDFDRVPRLGLLASSFEEDYVRLATAQYEALSGSEINDRIFCTGGAGSGKSLLAAETARRAAAAGDRVLLTCRSRGVADMLQRLVGTTSVICLPYDEVLATPQEPFDLLVVDEAQDFMNVEDYLELDGLLRGGLTEGRWRIFGDPNNQANIDGRMDPEVVGTLSAAAARYQLPYNCRNTSSVVQQTQLLTGADIGIAKAGEGPPVEFEQCVSDADAARLLDAHLKRLRGEEIDLSDVVVLTLRDHIADSAATATRAHTRGRLVGQDGAVRAPGVALLTTARDYKGLEAAHVLVIDIDDLSPDAQLSRFYVAMTRPRISLWLGVNPGAWKQLADGSHLEGVDV